MTGKDLANEYVSGLSNHLDGATSSENGDTVDCQDCGPEITVDFVVTTNPGDDTTIAVKLQESTDNSTWSDVSGATMTNVAGDTTNNHERKTFFNGNARYYRTVATLTGTSPVVDAVTIISARKASY